MKIAIVKSSILHQEGTWDPEHYLGYECSIKEDIAKREDELKRKQTTLDNLHKKLAMEKERIAGLRVKITTVA